LIRVRDSTACDMKTSWFKVMLNDCWMLYFKIKLVKLNKI